MAYDLFLQDGRVWFHAEGDAGPIESALRRLTSARRPLSRHWPDAYLVAFAEVAGLTLVTFDRALRRMGDGNTLLLS